MLRVPPDPHAPTTFFNQNTHASLNTSAGKKTHPMQPRIPSRDEALAALKEAPALSVGILIFASLFQAIYPKDSKALLLSPSAPLDLNLNALSFYIFPHVNWFHLLLNLVLLYPLLSRFERTHGTVYTGVTLNLLAVVTALQYCIVGLVLYPLDYAGGLSGIVFSLLTFFCYKEHVASPVIATFKFNGREALIPTLYFPFINLLIVGILIPSTSFFGHLFGIVAGYLLAMDKIKFMYPPLKVLLFIELKVEPGILQLKKIVNYIREDDALAERGVSYQPILSTDVEVSAGANEGFSRRLGSAEE